MVTGFWWVLTAFLVYGVIHSALAALRFKAWLRQRIGANALRYYRLVYNLFAGLSLLPVLALVVLLPDASIYSIPMPWLLLNVALQAAAGIGLLIALLQTGASDFLGLSAWLRPQQPEVPPSLILHGFYRWVRHPLYFFGLVILWLTPLLTWNLLAFNLGASLYILTGAWLEERKLLAEFGQAYADYQKSTPFLIPRKPSATNPSK